MYDLIIKDGNVVSPSSTIRCDIAINDGKIVGLGNYEIEDGKRIVNAEGKYVLPGTIEAHMHCMAPFQGAFGANNFYQQSVSAAFGGVTMFMDFANVYTGDSVFTQVKERVKEMSPSAIDYSVHGKFVESPPEIIDEIEELAKFGVPTFKMFMTYKRDGVMSDDETLLKVFEKAKEVNGLPMLHCESDPIFEHNLQKFEKSNDFRWVNFAKSKPVICEAEAFARACYLAESVESPILVVHTTNKDALDKAREQHKKDLPVYVETGPHYLTLFDEIYEREDGYLAICSPPLRTKKEADELWEGIKDGTIQLIGSDDCTFDVDEKSMNIKYDEDGNMIQDFRDIVNGLSGIEIRLPVFLSEGVNKDRISINKVVELLSTNIAKIYGCYPQKGIIAPGSDADIVIVDMEKEVTLSKDVLHNNISYCLHDGMKIKGYPIITIASGNIIVEDGKFYGKENTGRFIERKINPKILKKFGLN